MPKRYADSAVHDLKKYDQLKRAYRAQQLEVDYAYLVIDAQQEAIDEIDSLNTANVDYYEDYALPRQKKKMRTLGLVVVVETVLLLLILL